MPIKILIADDHPLIAEGIKNTLLQNKNIDVVALAADGKRALEYLEKHSVDIALLDINMPKMDGIECAKKIIAEHSKVKVVMLSMYQEASIIRNLIELGVKGYMLKTIPAEELLAAIEKISEGKEYFQSEVTKALINNDNSTTFLPFVNRSELIDELTDREKQIIRLITEGHTNTQIGEKLYISPRTVDTHRTNIMKKINVHNVASLIRFAFQNGLS